MQDKSFKVVDKPIYFSDAMQAQEYAKNHIGDAVVRNTPEDKYSLEAEDTPSSILNYLNRFIVSQDEAQKEVAIAMYYHSLRMKHNTKKEIQTNGPLMIVGPTGSGKTFIVKKACEFVDTVFVHVDTSSMVSEGIVGYNIGKLAADILKKAKLDINKASYCVVFFDEIDKLFQSNDSEYADEVANQLLRFVEGTEVIIPAKELDNKEDITLETNNMQFILGGAFQWIIDKKNSEDKTSVGFSINKTKETNSNITLEDLYREDIPKELLGRMHTIVNMHKLSQDDCYNILTKSENSPLNEFVDKLMFHGDSIEISDETIKKVASVAAKSELGVRAMKQILKKMFTEALFEAPNCRHKIHRIVYRG